MKSWPELIGSGNPENGDYLAGLREDKLLIVTMLIRLLHRHAEDH